MPANEIQGTAKLFMNGRSQAVRLPQSCRFEGAEVYFRKVGDEVILSPRPVSWDDYFASSERPSRDFMDEREDMPAEERAAFQ